MKSVTQILRLRATTNIGITTFVLLYLLSSALYPGGSQADMHSTGFDWVHNYWCNLMNTNGINGKPNSGRPFAIAGMICLCVGLATFFIVIANKSKSKNWSIAIEISGVLSMTFAALMFTEYHDLLTTISSLLGFVAVIGVIREIYLWGITNYILGGLFCIFLLLANNFIYYSGHYIEALPLLQKISFAVVLTWVLGVNNNIAKPKS